MKWDEDTLPNYREDVNNQMYELIKKQETELPTLQQIEKRSKSILNHRSGQISDLRKRQESFVLFGKYKEAKKLGKVISKVMEKDIENNKTRIIDKLNQRSNDLKRRHQKEIIAMEMKIKAK